MKKLLHEQLEGGIGKPVKIHANGRVVWLDRDDAKALAAEIKHQYFPRLRYKDGESVQLGGTASFDGNDFEIEKTIYYKSGLVTICEMSGNGHSYMPGDFVERPEPKLFDADGVRYFVYQTVFDKDGASFGVIGLSGDGFVVAESIDKEPVGQKVIVTPETFTHERPVFDADGERIKAGDTVWSIKDGRLYEWTVIDPYDEGDGSQMVFVNNGSTTGHIPPEKLTHREPDSLEKLRDDIRNSNHATNACAGIWDKRLTTLIERGA